jgi:hypothetical protein
VSQRRTINLKESPKEITLQNLLNKHNFNDRVSCQATGTPIEVPNFMFLQNSVGDVKIQVREEEIVFGNSAFEIRAVVLQNQSRTHFFVHLRLPAGIFSYDGMVSNGVLKEITQWVPTELEQRITWILLKKKNE